MIVVALVLATLLAFALGGGNLALAVAPAALVGLGLLLVRVPARIFALGLLALVLGIDSPQDAPAEGKWTSPLAPVGRLLFQGLGRSMGLPFPVTGIDLLVLAMLLGVVLRWLTVDGRERAAAAGLFVALGMYVATLAGLIAWGMARGGDFQAAYWQVRQMALLPLFAFALHDALRGTRAELVALGRIIVGAAVLKTLQGAWYYYAVARPAGYTPAYVTTHADTVLFVGALLVLGIWFVESRTRHSLLLLSLAGPVILWGIVLNDRRLAWGSLLLAAGAIWLVMKRDETWRRVTRALFWIAPVLALYVAAGWNSSSGIFAPVQALNSANDDSDSSTFAREVENFNLSRTVRLSPVIGQGYGHGYHEFIHHEIGRSFDLYRHMPHNAIYGLFMIGGVVGFTLIWLPLSFAVFFAVRTYRKTGDRVVRTAALVCAGGVMLFVVQAWGDMGTQNYLGVLSAAAALAVSARLAVNVGAWPRVVARSMSAAKWPQGAIGVVDGGGR